jgi:hypothetical protein
MEQSPAATSVTYGRPSLTPGSVPSQGPSSSSTADPIGGVQSPNNGTRIQTELARMFENYVGMNGFPLAAGEDMPNANLPTPDSASGSGFGPNGNLFQHFRDMF